MVEIWCSIYSCQGNLNSLEHSKYFWFQNKYLKLSNFFLFFFSSICCHLFVNYFLSFNTFVYLLWIEKQVIATDINPFTLWGCKCCFVASLACSFSKSTRLSFMCKRYGSLLTRTDYHRFSRPILCPNKNTLCQMYP